jgi:hypothetical protein
MTENQRVSQRDLVQLRTRCRKEGLGIVALRLFKDEPALVATIMRRRRRIEKLMSDAGASEGLIALVADQAYLMCLEPCLALHAAHRALWDDLLPVDEPESQNSPEEEEND